MTLAPIFPTAQAIAEIRTHHRARVDFLRARNRIILQCKAICRRWCEGDKTEADKLYKRLEAGEDHALIDYLAPFFAAMGALDAPRKANEKAVQGLAKQLPAYGFVAEVKGFGALGFGQIVGETGDLSNYANPAKLWKRMGLGVTEGEADRRKAGVENGYAPQRRSIMFVIGDSLIKANDSAYRDLYDQRKAYEVERNSEIEKWRAHYRAHRYMEKRLLRDLWSAWRTQAHLEKAA